MLLGYFDASPQDRPKRFFKTDSVFATFSASLNSSFAFSGRIQGAGVDLSVSWRGSELFSWT
jgi:hypothetical protein